MIIEADFGFHKEYISCSDELGVKIKELQNEFFDWIYDKNIDHKYWVFRNGEKYGVAYAGEALVFWLNNYHINSEDMDKVRLVDCSEDIISKVEKSIFF